MYNIILYYTINIYINKYKEGFIVEPREEIDGKLVLTATENSEICAFFKMFEILMKLQSVSETHCKMVGEYINIFAANGFVDKEPGELPSSFMLKLNIAGIINNRKQLSELLPKIDADIKAAVNDFTLLANGMVKKDSGIIVPGSANKIKPVSADALNNIPNTPGIIL